MLDTQVEIAHERFSNISRTPAYHRDTPGDPVARMIERVDIVNDRSRECCGITASHLTGTIEERVTRQEGLQITVDLEEGSTVAIVQAADQPFAVGERVKVLRGRGGAARVNKI